MQAVARCFGLQRASEYRSAGFCSEPLAEENVSREAFVVYHVIAMHSQCTLCLFGPVFKYTAWGLEQIFEASKRRPETKKSKNQNLGENLLVSAGFLVFCVLHSVFLVFGPKNPKNACVVLVFAVSRSLNRAKTLQVCIYIYITHTSRLSLDSYKARQTDRERERERGWAAVAKSSAVLLLYGYGSQSMSLPRHGIRTYCTKQCINKIIGDRCETSLSVYI